MNGILSQVLHAPRIKIHLHARRQILSLCDVRQIKERKFSRNIRAFCTKNKRKFAIQYTKGQNERKRHFKAQTFENTSSLIKYAIKPTYRYLRPFLSLNFCFHFYYLVSFSLMREYICSILYACLPSVYALTEQTFWMVKVVRGGRMEKVQEGETYFRVKLQ